MDKMYMVEQQEMDDLTSCISTWRKDQRILEGFQTDNYKRVSHGRRNCNLCWRHNPSDFGPVDCYMCIIGKATDTLEDMCGCDRQNPYKGWLYWSRQKTKHSDDARIEANARMILWMEDLRDHCVVIKEED